MAAPAQNPPMRDLDYEPTPRTRRWTSSFEVCKTGLNIIYLPWTILESDSQSLPLIPETEETTLRLPMASDQETVSFFGKLNP